MKKAGKKDPLLGQVIGGRYEITRLIGKGGMGTIDEVRHKKLRRTFAVKCLAPALAEDAEALARFQREADVVAGLRHPNIVEIVDWESLEDGTPCIIMEYLHGDDLGRRLKQGPLPWASIAQIADPILSALMVAHRAGIIHRDLKPQNIFLSQDDAGEEHPKLLDFGVSKIWHSESLMTGDDRLLGTPAYMAPEQADGRPEQVGPATDVWAMGAILFEMATGKPAFAAASTPSVLYRICHGDPEPLSAFRADAPTEFIDAIGCAISRDPLRRLETIEQLRRRLRSALFPVAPGAYHEPLRASITLDPEKERDRGKDKEEKTETQPQFHLNEEPTEVTPSPSTLSRAMGQRALTTGQRRERLTAPLRSRWSLLALGAAALVLAGTIVTVTFSGHKPLAPEVAAPQPVVTAPQPVVTQLKAPPPPRRHLVSLRVTPPGAALMLDGKELSARTLEVSGRHHLHAVARGYLPFDADLDEGTPGELEVTLQHRRTAADQEAAGQEGAAAGQEDRTSQDGTGQRSRSAQNLMRAAIFMAWLLAAGGLARAGEEQHRAAQQLVEDGSVAWTRHDYQTALERYRQAYALFPSAKLHYNLALALGSLGRPAEAAAEYQQFLDEARDAPPAARAAAEKQLAELDHALGRLQLQVDVDGAEVIVDDRLVGTTPLAHALRVGPGSHQLVVRHDGFVDDQEKLLLDAGESRRLELQLQRRARAHEPRGRWLVKRWWFWSALGVVVTAGVVAGAVAGSQPRYPDSKLGVRCPFSPDSCP